MESNKDSYSNALCCNSKLEDSVRQTLLELDFERGIWYAAQSNDLDRVRFFLNKGTSPDILDAAGYTALHYAARNGHEKICKELLNQGANVNSITRSGKATALHRAVTQKHIHIVKLLLNANADVNVQDADGLTPLHRAIIADCDDISKLLIPITQFNLKDKLNRSVKDLSKKILNKDLFEKNL